MITHAQPIAILTDTAAAAPPPDWVRLMPVGDIAAIDGRKWVLADPDAVIAASLKNHPDLVVDYDHATDRGGPAPAAGWIRELAVRDGHICARIEWTRAGGERIEGREYRFLSPTFLSDKKGRVTRILRAALVNSPALPELGALAKEDHMPQPNEEATALADLRAQIEAQSAAIEAAKADLAAAQQSLAAERAALAAEKALATATADVQRLVAAGKVPPGAAAELAGLLAHLETVPADAAGKKPRATLISMLQSLTGRVDLREISAPPPDGSEPPARDPVADLATEARAYQAECRARGLDEPTIDVAVRHVQAQRAAR